MNSNIIITTSKKDSSFLVYDIKEKKIIFDKEKIEDLNDLSCEGKKRRTYRPFGICRDSDDIFIVSNSKIGHFDAKTYSYKGLLDNVKCFVNTHQILKHEEKLFICNTANDSLGIYDLSTKQNKYLMLENLELVDDIDPPKDAYEKDKLHFNSILKHQDSLFLLLNNSGYSEILEIGLTDFQFKNRIKDIGIFNHNLAIYKDHLYSVSSLTGKLMRHSFESKENQFFDLHNDFDKFFLRGMVEIDEKLFIALSKKFVEDVYEKTARHCLILEYDLETQSICDEHFLNLNKAILDIA
jgi:hypothetical protein